MAGENAVPANVVEGEGERCQQSCDHTVGIKPQRGVPADNADGECDSCNSNQDGGGLLRRKALLPPCNHLQQHPNRRSVLQDDRDGDAGLLDSDVIEVIRCRHAEHAQDKALNQVGSGKLDALPAAATYQNWQ